MGDNQMSRKKAAKPHCEMTTEELREATREFDHEFVADQSNPLTAEMEARWDRAKIKSPDSQKSSDGQTISEGH
jgi:hypothetical protein